MAHGVHAAERPVQGVRAAHRDGRVLPVRRGSRGARGTCGSWAQYVCAVRHDRPRKQLQNVRKHSMDTQLQVAAVRAAHKGIPQRATASGMERPGIPQASLQSALAHARKPRTPANIPEASFTKSRNSDSPLRTAPSGWATSRQAPETCCSSRTARSSPRRGTTRPSTPPRSATTPRRAAPAGPGGCGGAAAGETSSNTHSTP